MRYYKNLIARRIANITEDRKESRDAVVWEVFDGYCRVKIQGSTKFINAYFPENTDKEPSWIRRGNAVKIQHTGGERGRIEVVGHSNVIPTNAPPFTPNNPEDKIISGCQLRVKPTYNILKVGIGVGRYQIGGKDYYLTPIKMSTNNLFVMGDGNIMSTISSFVPIDACSGNRYDPIIVDADKIPRVIKGIETSGTPVMPDIPEGSLRLGWILLYPGISKIENNDIGAYYYSGSKATYLDIIAEDTDIAWDEPISTGISVRVLNDRKAILEGDWYISASIIEGNGFLTSAEDGNGVTVSQHSIDNIVSFLYTRNKTAGDISPRIKFTLVAKGIEGRLVIYLRDIAGDIMI